jgi:quinol monooxygenase YgiN
VGTIHLVTRFPKIEPGDLADFEQIVAEMVTVMRAEAGVLAYDWYFNPRRNGLCGARDLPTFHLFQGR